MERVPPLIGHHGTNAANVKSIFENNFTLSTRPDLWCGPAVYFFTEGIGDPVVAALDWAIREAWSKETKRHRYTRCAVIRADITPAKLFDATSDDGLRAVDYARKELAKKGALKRNNLADEQIIQLLVAQMKIDVVVLRLYISSGEERKLNIRSRMPNVRVVCVLDPSALNPSTFQVVHEESIETHDI